MNSKSSKNQELNLRHRGSGLLGGMASENSHIICDMSVSALWLLRSICVVQWNHQQHRVSHTSHRAAAAEQSLGWKTSWLYYCTRFVSTAGLCIEYQSVNICCICKWHIMYFISVHCWTGIFWAAI